MGPFGKKFDGAKVWFISDLHLQHKNICRGESSWEDKGGCRDFDTIDEMNEGIIQPWELFVPKDAVVFNGGDICFGDKSKLPSYLARMKCSQHHLVYGNHDEWIRKSNSCQGYFDSCSDYLEIFCSMKGGGYKQVNLFHYPLKSWNNVNKGAYALTGHEHGDMPYPEDRLALDVGWEVFQRPISFYEVDEILKKRQMKKIHHKGRIE